MLGNRARARARKQAWIVGGKRRWVEMVDRGKRG